MLTNSGPNTFAGDSTGLSAQLAASADRGLARLPETAAAAVVEFTVGALSDGPKRVGHPLRREPTGQWSARRGPYRIVYEVDDEGATVLVLRIDHRSDVYRSR